MGHHDKNVDFSDEEMVNSNSRAVQRETWRDEHDDVGGWLGGDVQDKEKGRLAETYSVEGDREQTMESEVATTLEPLNINNDTRKESSGGVGRFADAFNVYCLPMGMALSALGRVQDLKSTGMPELPDEMSKKEKKTYRRLSDKGSDATKKSAYADWKTERKETKSSLKSSMGLIKELQGAEKEWRRMKTYIERRITEGKLEGVQNERARLQALASFIGGVTDLVINATLTFAAIPDAGMGGWEMGGGNLVTEFVKILGGDDKFEAQIQHYQKEIKDLKLSEDQLGIEAARDQLKGVAQQHLAGAEELGNNEDELRERAKLFGQSMGGEDPDADTMVIPMLAAAYQELVMCGEQAKAEGKKVKKFLPDAQDFVHRYKPEIKQYEASRDNPYPSDLDMMRAVAPPDSHSVMIAGKATVSYNDLVDKELKDWKKKEDAWTGFFEDKYR